ncbi:MAG: D-alanine--D-alanine ligase [Pseudomonadota bacterium]
MNRKYHRIAVLSGGTSAEREVSLVSARGSYEALIRLGYDAHLVDPADKNWPTNLIELKADAVLNMLHGTYGEDGVVQGLLESLQLPYSHSGVRASALAMDKSVTKYMLAHYGLPVAHSIAASPKDIMSRADDIEFPCVLKPVSEGSSKAIFILESAEQIPKSFLENSSYKQFMLEKYIPGRELTVSVLNGKAMAVTEITSGNSFYDYEAKYSTGGSQHIIPADLPRDIYNKLMDYAEKAHEILGCRGVTRTDFRYDESDSCGIIILEINTQPGMTPTSLVPEQAAYIGLSYDELVQTLTEDASCPR